MFIVHNSADYSWHLSCGRRTHFHTSLSSTLCCQKQMLLCEFTTSAAANQSAHTSCFSATIGRWTRLLASRFWFPVGASRCPNQRAERDVTPGVTSNEFGERDKLGKTQFGRKCGKRNGLERSFPNTRQPYHTGADVI